MWLQMRGSRLTRKPQSHLQAAPMRCTVLLLGLSQPEKTRTRGTLKATKRGTSESEREWMALDLLVKKNAPYIIWTVVAIVGALVFLLSLRSESKRDAKPSSRQKRVVSLCLDGLLLSPTGCAESVRRATSSIRPCESPPVRNQQEAQLKPGFVKVSPPFWGLGGSNRKLCSAVPN